MNIRRISSILYLCTTLGFNSSCGPTHDEQQRIEAAAFVDRVFPERDQNGKLVRVDIRVIAEVPEYYTSNHQYYHIRKIGNADKMYKLIKEDMPVTLLGNDAGPCKHNEINFNNLVRDLEFALIYEDTPK